MYVAELQELRNVEEQLTHALGKMQEMAQHPRLKQAFATHLKETHSQRDRLDVILQRHSATTREHQDLSMEVILRETDIWAKMVEDPDLRDAGQIASAQRVEHYEIAVYGTPAAWARQLGFDEDQRAISDILEEERRTDETLSGIAKRVVNQDAVST
jgi:ferritin-like metal-binding protein YciE